MFWRRKKALVQTESFYKANADCQVPHLDWLYENSFGFIRDGVFVEVGAYDGEYVSNTNFLADMGWQGFYIEPVPTFYQKCLTRHAGNPNTCVDQLAIGSTSGTVEIQLAGPLSSIDQTTIEIFKKLTWAMNNVSGKKVRVKQETLDAYLFAKGVNPGFELLVIDVEGYELEVLSGFSLEKWNPKMVIIELHDQNREYREIRQKCLEIVRIFDSAGYIAAYKDFTNTVYTRKENIND